MRRTADLTSDYVYQIDKSSRLYYSTIGCTITSTSPPYYTSLPIVPVGGGAVSGVGKVGAGMNAYSIQIRWQASDVEAVATAMPTAAQVRLRLKVNADILTVIDLNQSIRCTESNKFGTANQFFHYNFCSYHFFIFTAY